uniref:Uncharacterized protein n=1 Tax=Setaria italica TaxID=4555 RepID=K4APE5_SETIT
MIEDLVQVETIRRFWFPLISPSQEFLFSRFDFT